MNKAQVVLLFIVVGIFVALVSLGVTLISVPKFEVIDAFYYASYPGSGVDGDCKLTIKNTASSAAYNVNASIRDFEDRIIKEESKGTVNGGASFTITSSLSKATATQEIKVTISYSYVDSSGKTVSNTVRMAVKLKSIVP